MEKDKKRLELWPPPPWTPPMGWQEKEPWPPSVELWNKWWIYLHPCLEPDALWEKLGYPVQPQPLVEPPPRPEGYSKKDPWPPRPEWWPEKEPWPGHPPKLIVCGFMGGPWPPWPPKDRWPEAWPWPPYWPQSKS